MPEKSILQSQTELVMVIGAFASALAAMGIVTLTPEQIAAMATILFAIGGITRYVSDGTKLVLNNSRVAQELLDEDSDMPTIDDVKADLQSGFIAATKVQQAAAEAGFTNDQVQKLIKALQK